MCLHMGNVWVESNNSFEKEFWDTYVSFKILHLPLECFKNFFQPQVNLNSMEEITQLTLTKIMEFNTRVFFVYFLFCNKLLIDKIQNIFIE